MGIRACLLLLGLLLGTCALAQEDIYVAPDSPRPAAPQQPSTTAAQPQPKLHFRLGARTALVSTSLLSDPQLRVQAANGLVLQDVEPVNTLSAYAFANAEWASIFGVQAEAGYVQKASEITQLRLGRNGAADTNITFRFRLHYFSLPVAARIRAFTRHQQPLGFYILLGAELNVLTKATQEIEAPQLFGSGNFQGYDVLGQVHELEVASFLGFNLCYTFSNGFGLGADARFIVGNNWNKALVETGPNQYYNLAHRSLALGIQAFMRL